MLGEDWEDLSVVEEIDDASVSERGAWSLAGEIIQKALVEEEAEAPADDHLATLQPVGALDSRRWKSASEDAAGNQNGPTARHSWSDACGSSCNAAAAGVPESLVFAWGDNSSGQCLVGDGRQIVPTPEIVSLRCSCLSLCCGSRCSILVTNRGTLWGGGLNAGGTLSETVMRDSLNMPTYVDLAELENFDLAAVAAGSEHILAVTDGGVLLSWAASNVDGQAGVGPDLAKATPVLPRTPAWPTPVLRSAVRVATVACGDTHSLALTEGGEIYAFGSNACGQLGLGDALPKALVPSMVGGRARGVPVRAIAAGGKHSLALTISGAVFSWGDNSKGCLGLGADRAEQATVCLPAIVPKLPNRARNIAAGGCHSAVIVRKGRLLLAGDNECGQLGQPRSHVPFSHGFCEVSSRHGLSTRSVALGREHSLLLTYDGQLHAFGRNSEGQCGIGAVAAPDGLPFFESPVLVSLPTLPGRDCPLIVWAVAAGRDHNVVLCSPGPEAHERMPDVLSPTGSNPQPSRSFLVSGDSTLRRTLARRFTDEGLPASTKSANRFFSGTNETVRCADRTASGGIDAGCGAHVAGRFDSGCSSKAAMIPAVAVPLLAKGETEEAQHSVDKEPRKGRSPSFILLRPVAQPGAAPRSFTVLSVAQLAASLTNTTTCAQNEVRRALAAVLARPSVLNASFCYPGLRTARLDAAGLCRNIAALCHRTEGLGQQLLDAAAEGLGVLAGGPIEDLMQRDQLRALAVYLCLPAHRVSQPRRRNIRSMLSSIAHVIMRMSSLGRIALRDLIADECGDVRVLRDFLVPHARSLADDAIRAAGGQPWLAGPLWEVVAQLQLQRSLWEAVLLLQLLASSSEHAAQLLRCGHEASPSRTDAAAGNSSAGGGGGGVAPAGSWQGGEVCTSSSGSGSCDLGSGAAVSVLSLPGGPGPSMERGLSQGSLLDPSAFQLTSLADGAIPPEVEFWLFQEHAQFHQITPTEVVEEPWWADAAGMLPRRFCSFMAHGNLVPVAFKQRVLQVENVLRQRLSQEQVLWPQAAMVLGGGHADPTAFYFMLSVNRQSLLRDTFAQMYSASPVDLRRPLRVQFTGEEAVDEGGVMREFFRLLSQELFAPDAGLFFEAEDSRHLWFNTVLGPGRQLEDYWMVGVIVALAVYNNHPGMDAPLPSALFKKLKDHPTLHDDLAQLFPSHARSLELILSWTPSMPIGSEIALDAVDREFMDTFCLSYCLAAPGAREAPLCEGGMDRPVLYRDREEFAARMHEYLLHTSVQPQFESFARGFRRVCNSPLFDVLSPRELEAIVAGDKDLDFSRLRQGVQYEGYSPNEPYIESLWNVFDGFSLQRRRRFLAFCTGSDVAPAGGLQDLRLLVQRHGEEPTTRLPVAHTCFNLLLLPRYGSVDKLRAMLVTAIEWTEGFGLQ